MSKLGKTWAWWALALALGCGSSAQGTDGSTHWVKCETDADCPEQSCNAGRCGGVPSSEEPEATSETDGSAASLMPEESAAGPEQNATPNSNGTAEPASEMPPTGAPLGAACLPGDEYQSGFSGFSKDAISFGDNPECASNLCLVNHFQGRVTCPYGQGDEQTDLCSLPGSEEPVTARVEPQLEERPPTDAVYCSCRCDGPDPDADYCDCGDGFDCVNMVNIEIAGQEDRLGSYCVKAGSNPPSDDISERRCDAATTSCGDPADFSLEALGIEPLPEGQAPSNSVAVLFDQLIVSGERCLSRTLAVGGTPTTPIPCRIFEARSDESSDCEARSRRSLGSGDLAALRDELRYVFACESDADCERFSVCEIPQILAADDPDAYASCLTEVDSDSDGWCYVAPEEGRGAFELVSHCTAPANRQLRFLGTGTPAEASILFMACLG